MLRFLLIRLLRLIPTAWGIISIIFLLSRTLPTDQLLTQALGEQIDVGSRTITLAERQAAEQAVRHRLGLDEPIFYFSVHRASTITGPKWQWNGLQNQYHRWWRNLLRGELGRSFRDNRPVTDLLAEALGCTLPLTLLAAALAVAFSLWLALWMTQHPRGRAFLLPALYGLDALPLFVVALLLLYLFANPDVLPIFPAYGFGNHELSDSRWELVGIYFYHLILPVSSLVLITLPSLIAHLDASLQQELETAYVVTARAKGLAFWQVVRHHTLRNALLPVVTLFTDLLPALVAGAVIVEVIFALPGMGRLLADAAATRDYPVLQAGVLLITLIRLLSHVVADGLYLRIDPRIRPHV